MSAHLSIAEAAEMLGISRSSCYALVRRGGIEHLAHPYGRIQIPEEACIAYLESIRVRPALPGARGSRIAPNPINHDALLERSRLEAMDSVRNRRSR